MWIFNFKLLPLCFATNVLARLFQKKCVKLCSDLLRNAPCAHLSCHSRPAIPHLPTSCNYWASRLSSSPASPTASYEPLPSVDTVHRCFDDHLPPIVLRINFLLWLLSHFHLQSCILAHKDYQTPHLFSPPEPTFVLQHCDSVSHFLILSTSPELPSCMTFQ